MTLEVNRVVDAVNSGFPWTRREQSTIRVLTVDKDPLIREGLSAIFSKQRGIHVIAEASSGSEALRCFRDLRPDVVTLDLLLPDMAGEEFAAQLLLEFPDARIVVLTAARGDVRLRRALAIGVKGLALKSMRHTELLEVIRQVHGGKRAIPKEVATTLAEHFGEEGLTDREVQVLKLVAGGNRNKQAAALLSIADETVRMHMKNILGKLAAHDRTHAVTIALSRGIFQL